MQIHGLITQGLFVLCLNLPFQGAELSWTIDPGLCPGLN